jgi:hypothetical protein
MSKLHRKDQTAEGPNQKAPLIDEFNDLIMMLMNGHTWTPQQRNAYNKLHRRIERVTE